MTISNDSSNAPRLPVCPLARDEDGAAIVLPDDAATWRVRRKTGGRPRIVLGVDKQPMQLPLGYTIVDLEDVLAPAEYLLDLVDSKGNGLGLTIPISVGQQRNAEDGNADSEASTVVATALPTSGSETRLVLEANVRATQMAFLHNQKTLELGLRMAETLRDGVRVMAESQADWIKSVSSARGFFRNAPPLPLPAPASPAHDDDDDDDEDEDYEPVPEHWVDKLMPHVVPIVQMVVPILTAKLSKRPSTEGEPQAKLELADLLDWRRPAAKRLAAEAPPAPAAPEPAALPPLDMQAAAHFMQIQQALTEQEATMARATAAHLSPVELRIWLDELKQLSVPNAVAKIRAFLASQSKPAA